MSLTAIETLLKDTMGLNAASIGSATVARAVHLRMGACGINDEGAYFARVRGSASELTALIEQVVIPETWFFRNVKPFEALRKFIGEEWMTRGINRVLRVLSLPCSTGEEPYTIAMTLHDAGLAPSQIHIDAVDISEKNLAAGRTALYTQNSFRGDDISFRDRFFTPQDNKCYLLNDTIRKMVHFEQGNMLDYSFVAGRQPYDVVFCRNLMIYFDRPTQERAINVLDRLLDPKGILFVGHAEANLIMSYWSSSHRHPAAFAFRKHSDERRSQTDRRAQTETPSRPQAERRRTRRERRLPPAPAPVVAPFAETLVSQTSHPAPKSPASTDLEEASRLANEGHLVEAASLCEQHVEDHGPSVQAFYLLALVRDAAGNQQQAESLLRKVIYLDPTHQEALTHLALMLESQGNTEGAGLLRQRAQRAAERSADEQTQAAS